MAKFLTVVPSSGRIVAPYLATAEPVVFDAGFYEEEPEETGAFHWMGLSGVLRFAAADVRRYLEVWAHSEFRDLSQRLTCESGNESYNFDLIQGWGPVSVAIAPGAEHVRFGVNKIFPPEYYRDDSRTLAIRIRRPLLHQDPARHAHVERQALNSAQNLAEMNAGAAFLHSTPTSLGIDLHGVCNVKPPCVYCEWDGAKEMEGGNVDVPFTHETLREWGEFFDNSVSLVNCSIGEPFMMKNFDDLLDIFGDTGKVLEMTTNGQILTERNVQKLVGRPIDLYISLDAASRETYARLRNDTWDKLLVNIRRLIDAKGGRGKLPRVHLVFMPMRANVHELDAFISLCAELNVDRMVLRPLNASDNTELVWDRAGYHYDYVKEMLSFDELIHASGRAAELCARLGVPLADQLDFGDKLEHLFEKSFGEGRSEVEPVPADVPLPPPSPVAAPAAASVTPAMPAEPAPDARLAPAAAAVPAAPKIIPLVEQPLPSLGGETRPACYEPWKSLYILRRGVLPCCYGYTPIAPMSDYRDAWNSPLMQDIRKELASGRLHDYCLRSPACPILRKSEHASSLPLRQRLTLKARHAWHTVDRSVFGGKLAGVRRRVRWVWIGAHWVGIRVAHAARDPRYIVAVSKRFLGNATAKSTGPTHPRP